MKENRKTRRISSTMFLSLMITGLALVNFNTVEAETASIQIEKPKITQIKQEELISGCIELEPFVPYFELTAEERKIVECVVSGEARGETYIGKVLVAQCILNACIQDGLQPSEVRTQYQYSGWCDEVSDEIKQAVNDVFYYGKIGVEANILWFYAPKYTKGKFHNTQKFIIEEGGHRFYAPLD